MTPRIIGWGLLAVLLTTGPTFAQQSPSSARSFDTSAVKAQEQQRQQKMYEDIEIMRRLLDRMLLSVPGVKSSPGAAGVAYGDLDGDGWVDVYVANDSGGNNKQIGAYIDAMTQIQQPGDRWHHGQREPVSAEGVYLPGQGVVYSATLPVHFWQPLQKTAAGPTRKPLTDWERTRKELAGEKIDQEENAATSSEVSLADRVLKLLFDNGRHFGQLEGKEGLTVALTLRVEGQCTACHQHPWKTSAQSAADRGLQWLKAHPPAADSKVDSGSNTAAGLAALAAASLTGQEQRDRREAIAKAAAEVHKQTLLGDLHMKQGQPADAIEAYRKAFQLQIDVAKLRFPKGTSPDLKSHLEAIELNTKLAQALLAAGRSEEAKSTLESQVVAFAFKAVARENEPRAAAVAPKIDLPSKVIVSAPKALLDEAGAGKITFAEFKKAASVQYVTFPTAKSEVPKPKSPPAGGN